MSDVLDRLEDVDRNRRAFVVGGPRALVPLIRDAATEVKFLRWALRQAVRVRDFDDYVDQLRKFWEKNYER